MAPLSYAQAAKQAPAPDAPAPAPTSTSRPAPQTLQRARVVLDTGALVHGGGAAVLLRLVAVHEALLLIPATVVGEVRDESTRNTLAQLPKDALRVVHVSAEARKVRILR